MRFCIKTHSGGKSKKCNQCDYAFSHAANPRTHIKIHSGEKSNKCNQCDFTSSHADNLRKQRGKVKHAINVTFQTSFCGEVGFGIWLSNTTEKFQNSLKNLKTHSAAPREFSNFSVSFEIFPWCLKAKFQIPPLRRRMFVINITTRGASRPYVSWLSSPTTLHHDCIASRPHPSGS